MTLALALINIIVPLIPLIAGDISGLVAWISSVRTAAKQTGEWTDALDQSFRAAVIASGKTDPAWQP